jgi:uncharacterized membrane protein YecN with MAPEG domain
MAELSVPITGVYAALQAFVVMGLLWPIQRLRTKYEVSLHAGQHPDLEVAIRRHANWTEHVPFALLLIGLLELNGGSAALLHGLGVGLLVARVAHPFGLKHDVMRVPLRVVGAVGTILVTLVAAVALLLGSL